MQGGISWRAGRFKGIAMTSIRRSVNAPDTSTGTKLAIFSPIGS